MNDFSLMVTDFILANEVTILAAVMLVAAMVIVFMAGWMLAHWGDPKRLNKRLEAVAISLSVMATQIRLQSDKLAAAAQPPPAPTPATRATSSPLSYEIRWKAQAPAAPVTTEVATAVEEPVSHTPAEPSGLDLDEESLSMLASALGADRFRELGLGESVKAGDLSGNGNGAKRAAPVGTVPDTKKKRKIIHRRVFHRAPPPELSNEIPAE
jgi:hypothetical protein